MTTLPLYKVEISLKRVQTFIFEVPRLKAMLGANVLIGETMRNTLLKLAEGKTAHLQTEGVYGRDPEDPLKPDEGIFQDAPRMLIEKGILARDGGHFIAVFDNKDKAESFTAEAKEQLIRDLPGVMFDVFPPRLLGEDVQDSTARLSKAHEVQLLDLPVLQVCQETGRYVASKFDDKTSDKKKAVAHSVKLRLDAGRRFPHQCRDIVGLLAPQLGLTAESGWTAPEDINGLCAGGYLALIHADGNGVGRRYKSYRQQGSEAGSSTTPALLANEIRGEQFYHSMRVAVRRALEQSLKQTFVDRKGVRPYEVLMLGGDDLLLACRADKALAFAVNYACALKDFKLEDDKPLDVGIGVAIVGSSYPLHRAHALAEALASSAKQRYRADPTCGSVIDWQVITSSWFDDVVEARRSSEIHRYLVNGDEESVVLTRRPYPVLGTGGLQSLLKAVQSLDAGQKDIPTARSPLRALRTAFMAGRLSGQVAFDKLDESLRKTLTSDNGDSPWSDAGGGYWTTQVFDVVGIREISRLGDTHHD